MLHILGHRQLSTDPLRLQLSTYSCISYLWKIFHCFSLLLSFSNYYITYQWSNLNCQLLCEFSRSLVLSSYATLWFKGARFNWAIAHRTYTGMLHLQSCTRPSKLNQILPPTVIFPASKVKGGILFYELVNGKVSLRQNLLSNFSTVKFRNVAILKWKSSRQSLK